MVLKFSIFSMGEKVYYQCTIQATPGQDVFGREKIFNLTSFIDWQVITTENKWQVYIDNVRENNRGVRHEYTIGDLVFV